MAKTNTFHCSVITPEKAVLECDAKFVAFPAHDGEIGILPQRAPLVCKLGIGPMRIDTEDKKHVMIIDGGFAQVVNNKLSILTEHVYNIDELNAADAQKALEQARHLKITDEQSYILRSNAIQRAKTQLKLAKN